MSRYTVVDEFDDEEAFRMKIAAPFAEIWDEPVKAHFDFELLE